MNTELKEYHVCHDCQLADIRHCAHADTCGNSNTYPATLRQMIEISHSQQLPLSIIAEKAFDMGKADRTPSPLPESVEEEKVKIPKDLISFKEVDSDSRAYSLVSGIVPQNMNHYETAIEVLVRFTGTDAMYLHDRNRIIMAMEAYHNQYRQTHHSAEFERLRETLHKILRTPSKSDCDILASEALKEQ